MTAAIHEPKSRMPPVNSDLSILPPGGFREWVDGGKWRTEHSERYRAMGGRGPETKPTASDPPAVETLGPLLRRTANTCSTQGVAKTLRYGLTLR